MPFGTEGIQDTIGLCLSGGGFRASLFHVGGLWRLNELGLLSRIDRISSVSGGSITAGILAVHWNQLVFRNGVAENFGGVVNVVSDFCKREIDVPCVAEGALSPFSRASDELRKRYNKHGLPPDLMRFYTVAYCTQSIPRVTGGSGRWLSDSAGFWLLVAGD